jgi:lysophospholipase L1-like esterase
MLRLVAANYKGKYLSLLGDSISTFDGVTNNVKISSTMTNHRCYYRSSLLPDYTYTYWGRLQMETQMKLCVINGWSSSKVYGGGQGADNKVDATKDNLLVRASQLHTNEGRTPDLVIIYMGINDTRSSPSSIQHDSSKSNYTRNKTAGDLYARLTKQNSGKTEYEIVDEWFREVKKMANEAGKSIVPGKTYNTWEGAYALSIETILKTYNNPEIFCMTLIRNHHAAATEILVNRSNVLIRAIANYFGVGIIEQDNSEITMDNCHVYGADENETVTSLHPNIKGHEMTTRLIVRTLYEHIQKKNNNQ